MSKFKKRDKKKFKRQSLQSQNLNIKDIEDYDVNEIYEEKRAVKKTQDKGLKTQKSNLMLEKGRVIEIKSNYSAIVELNNIPVECNIGGRLKQINFETRNILAVGDFVSVDTLNEARIEEILPRRNSLSRFSEDEFQMEVIVAANIDQVIVTSSIFQPEIRLGLIDRYLCAAELTGIKPIICVNKIDLVDTISPFKEMLSYYENCGYQVIYTSTVNNIGMETLKQILKDKDSVFSGHSGAGKSSLLNALQPSLQRKTSEISEYTQKGVHTTTNSCMIKWDFGGYLIDTPGIKTFGLCSKHKDLLPRIFPGFNNYWRHCKFSDCTHTHEINCAVKKAVEIDEIPWERYESYVRILESL